MKSKESELLQDNQVKVIGLTTNEHKLTDWKNEPTVNDLLYDINKAKPTHSAQVKKMNDWVNLLYADTDKSKIRKGRSGITPKVIRRLAEWRYGSLSTSFLNEKKLFSVTASHPKYIQAAIQNELVLNFQFNALIDKVKFINDLVRSAVNEGTAIVRIGWETETQIKEKEEPVYIYVQAEPHIAMQIMQYMEQIGKETQEGNLSSSEDSPTFQSLTIEMQESIKASLEYGIPVVAQPTGEIQTIKEEVVTKNRPAVKVIPNANLIIDPSCEGDFDQARFAVYVFTTSYSELKSEGIYKNLDKIFNENTAVTGSNLLGLDDDTFLKSNNDYANSFNFKDKARQRLQAYEYWGYYDIDGNGIVQAIVATIVGNTIIRLERSPFPDNKLPFVVIPYLPIKGSVYGEPDGELIKDNQEIIQALTRSMIDIQARGANGQVARPKGFLDTINAKKFNDGEDYEYNPTGVHPSEAIFMHTANEIPQSIMVLLQQQYADAEAATGVKSFQGGIDGNAYGQAVAGMSQAITAITQREGDILFRVSKGLEKIGNKIIAMNKEWLAEEEVIAITANEFVPIKKSELEGDFFLNVTIKSNNEAEGKAQQLTFVAQTLGAEADWGLRKMFLMEICRLYNLDTMLASIKDYEPQPDPEQVAFQQQLNQLQLAELEAKINKVNAEADYFRSRGNFVEAQVDDVQASTDQKSLDFLQQQDGTKHARQKEIVEAQARAQNEGKVAAEILKNQRDLQKNLENNRSKEALARANNEAKKEIEDRKLQARNNKGGSIRSKMTGNAPRIDPATGRTFINIPAPRRSILPYKTPSAEPNEPTLP